MAGWLTTVFNHLYGPMDVEVWIEPFGGGAGAALMALEAHQVPEAWIVEANPALAAFWTTIMADGGQLAARVETTSPSLELFYESREMVSAALAGETTMGQEDLGYAAFILNRCSRSGMVLGNVGPIGGKQQSGQHTIGSRFHGERLAERLRAVSAFGQRFRVFHGNGIDYIDELDGSGIEHEVFLFADPPYLEVGNRLYAHGMRPECHSRLAAALSACQAPWVLTYDAHPRVLELYPDCEVYEFEIPHTANQQAVGTEYLVTSVGLATPGIHPLGKGQWWPVA